MAKTQDFTKVMQDMMSAFPVDAGAVQDAFKTSAALGEKFAKVALEAAEKSNEISSKWTKDTLTKVSALTKVKAEPADYTKAYSDFASAAAEMAAENLAAYAEVESGNVRLRALVGNAKTGAYVETEVRGPLSDPEALSSRAVEQLTALGALQLLASA